MNFHWCCFKSFLLIGYQREEISTYLSGLSHKNHPSHLLWVNKARILGCFPCILLSVPFASFFFLTPLELCLHPYIVLPRQHPVLGVRLHSTGKNRTAPFLSQLAVLGLTHYSILFTLFVGSSTPAIFSPVCMYIQDCTIPLAETGFCTD